MTTFRSFRTRSTEARRGWSAPSLLTAFFLIMLGAALGWFDRVQWRWLSVAGSLTYPLYLIHASAGVAVIYYLSPKLPKYLVLGGLCATMLVLAWLIHRFIERPLMAVVRRWLRSGVADLRAKSTLSSSSAPPKLGEPVPDHDAGTTDQQPAPARPRPTDPEQAVEVEQVVEEPAGAGR